MAAHDVDLLVPAAPGGPRQNCIAQPFHGSLYVHRLLRNPGNQPERQLGNDRPDISSSCSALPSRQSGHWRSLRFDEIWRRIIRSKIRSNARSTIFGIKTIRAVRWKLAEEASDSKGIERDVDIQTTAVNSLCQTPTKHQRTWHRQYDLERLSGCPREHLEFHLWYLKEKGWIGRLENGMLAITVEGVDRANSEHHRGTTTKLLTGGGVAVGTRISPRPPESSRRALLTPDRSCRSGPTSAHLIESLAKPHLARLSFAACASEKPGNRSR